MNLEITPWIIIRSVVIVLMIIVLLGQRRKIKRNQRRTQEILKSSTHYGHPNCRCVLTPITQTHHIHIAGYSYPLQVKPDLNPDSFELRDSSGTIALYRNDSELED